MRVGVPPQAVQKTACPIASQFVSTHQGPCPCTWLKRSYWGWVHRQSPPPAVEVQSSGVTAAIFSKLYMQIPAFWCTFSLKINSCDSAKYHVSIPGCITCIRHGITYYWKTTRGIPARITRCATEGPHIPNQTTTTKLVSDSMLVGLHVTISWMN